MPASVTTRAQNGLKLITEINTQIYSKNTTGLFRKEDKSALSRDGREITFGPTHKITEDLTTLMITFEDGLSKAQNTQQVAFYLGLFWSAFIAIHPFNNGNGRTGKRFLELRSLEHGYEITSWRTIDAYLIEGIPSQDLKNLQMLFINILRRKNS